MQKHQTKHKNNTFAYLIGQLSSHGDGLTAVFLADREGHLSLRGETNHDEAKYLIRQERSSGMGEYCRQSIEDKANGAMSYGMVGQELLLGNETSNELVCLAALGGLVYT